MAEQTTEMVRDERTKWDYPVSVRDERTDCGGIRLGKQHKKIKMLTC